MKDPAFLFYSKDFYEGTRLMLPIERACYIDLLIYQHQHGPIPNQLDRVTMYTSGIDQATLEATLEAKFELTEKGWVNHKLSKVVEDRRDYANKQSKNGKLGVFFKKAKAQLKAKEYKDLRGYIYNDLGKENFYIELEKNKGSIEGLLEASLKHLVIVNENVIVNKDLNNKGVDFETFWNLYDYKQAKPKCIEIWEKVSPEDKDLIMAYLPEYVRLTNKDGTFPSRKYPQGFLNGQYWLNELPQPEVNGIVGTTKQFRVKLGPDGTVWCTEKQLSGYEKHPNFELLGERYV